MYDETQERKPFSVAGLALEEEISAYIPRRTARVPTTVLPRNRNTANIKADETGSQDHTSVEEPSPTASATVNVTADLVNHPPHYTSHPSGVECITITEWMNFNLGNAMKYIWRAGDKGATIEDLKKARWYLDREIGRLEKCI